MIKDDKPVATISVLLNYNDTDGLGYIHMVGCKPECRGMGVGNFMATYAIYVLKKKGMKSAYLTTDDWRIPAIKTYLKMGLEPDIFDQEMKERWEAVFGKIK